MDSPQPDHKNWISELAGQSWNLEMLISGAAIFSTSFLPEFIEEMLESYFENYQSNNEFVSIYVPTLAYGFAKTIAYLLIVTFIVHFVVRAFWVGLVGLRAVYPEGIIYDKLPNANAQIRELYRNRFGDFDDFIVRLDRFCSQIFSIAFLLALFGVIMSMFYLLGFVLLVFFKSLSPDLYKAWAGTLRIIVLGFAFSLGFTVIILSQKYFREHPRWGRYYTKMVKNVEWMYFGLYKPMSYIMLIFASHIPLKRYLAYAMSIGVVFFSVGMYLTLKKMMEHQGLPWMESRQYYSSGTASFQFVSNHYDNLRTEGESVADASIQADIIREPFLKVFINYPHNIDTDIAQVCKVTTPPDSLPKWQQRRLLDIAKINCLQNYFQIVVNDSLYQNVEFLYEAHGTQKNEGITAYIPTQAFKTGRNTLYVKAIDTDSLPKRSLRNHAIVPFWFAPEN